MRIEKNVTHLFADCFAARAQTEEIAALQNELEVLQRRTFPKFDNAPTRALWGQIDASYGIWTLSFEALEVAKAQDYDKNAIVNSGSASED